LGFELGHHRILDERGKGTWKFLQYKCASIYPASREDLGKINYSLSY
jgi:hypothetical protein